MKKKSPQKMTYYYYAEQKEEEKKYLARPTLMYSCHARPHINKVCERARRARSINTTMFIVMKKLYKTDLARNVIHPLIILCPTPTYFPRNPLPGPFFLKNQAP